MNHNYSAGAISEDGRYVTLSSLASNLSASLLMKEDLLGPAGILSM